MSDKDFQSYAGSYENLVRRGLGESYALKARSFETLIIAERNQSLSRNPVGKTLATVKLLLERSLAPLVQLTGLGSSEKQLQRWQNEIEQATSAIELGVICQRICDVVWPLPKSATTKADSV